MPGRMEDNRETTAALLVGSMLRDAHRPRFRSLQRSLALGENSRNLLNKQVSTHFALTFLPTGMRSIFR